MLFFLILQLQTVSGYGALAAGMAFAADHDLHAAARLEGRSAGPRIGPRIPMTFGPLVMAAGALLLLRIGPDVDYLTDVLPGRRRSSGSGSR